MAGTPLFNIPTDYSAQAADIERQRRVAEMLQQQSMSPMETNQTAGGFVVPISPYAGLAKALQGYTGMMGQRKATERSQALGQQARDDAKSFLSAMPQAQAAIPAPADELGGGPGAPAQNPTKQQMMAWALSGATSGNPITQSVAAPLLAQYAKPREDFSLSPGQSRFDGAGGSLLATQPLAPDFKPVEAAGPTGAPETRFVDMRNPPAAPIAKPVENVFQNLGGVTQAVPKFGPAPATLAHTQSPDSVATDTRAAATLAEEKRNHNMVDARSRDANGILANGSLSPESESMAQAIASGQLAPLSGFALNKPGGRAVMSRVMQINPQYSATNFKVGQGTEMSFAKGPEGKAVRSFNVALSHLDTLDKLSDALHNGNLQMVNKLGNAYATQTGAPAPTDFNAAKKIVSDEIVKAIVGSGGGVADREEAAKTISAANSPAQLKGVINTYKELMRGQLGGLRQQYETNTGRKDFDRFLSDQAKAEEKPQRRATDKPGAVVNFGDLPP